MNEEAGRLLLEDYRHYAERAKLMTKIHAFHEIPPHPVEASDTNIVKMDRASASTPLASPLATPLTITESTTTSDVIATYAKEHGTIPETITRSPKRRLDSLATILKGSHSPSSPSKQSQFKRQRHQNMLLSSSSKALSSSLSPQKYQQRKALSRV